MIKKTCDIAWLFLHNKNQTITSDTMSISTTIHATTAHDHTIKLSI